MKNIKEIYEKLIQVLDESANNLSVFTGEDQGDRFYRAVSGWVKDDYFQIYLHDFGSVPVIEISHNTDNPQKLIKMIKAIEPDQPITYFETEIIHKEKTI